jgi:hypothetical protein
VKDDSCEETAPAPEEADEPELSNSSVSTRCSSLLSPLELSDVELVNFGRTGYKPPEDDFNDSGYASWIAPAPLSLTPPRSPAASSMTGPPSPSVLSPFVPSIRAPLIMTPPNAIKKTGASLLQAILEQGPSNGDLVRLSTMTLTAVNDSSPKTPKTPNPATISRPGLDSDKMIASSLSDDENDEYDGDVDEHASRWDDSEENPTVVFLGVPAQEEINSAVRSPSPVEFLSNSPDLMIFDDDEVEAQSSFEQSPPTNLLDLSCETEECACEEDETTNFGHMTEPKKQTRDETIDNFYDIYTTDEVQHLQKHKKPDAFDAIYPSEYDQPHEEHSEANESTESTESEMSVNSTDSTTSVAQISPGRDLAMAQSASPERKPVFTPPQKQRARSNTTDGVPDNSVSFPHEDSPLSNYTRSQSVLDSYDLKHPEDMDSSKIPFRFSRAGGFVSSFNTSLSCQS